MIFKMWVKSKVVFWQPRYNNLLTKKKVRKNFRFEALIFLKIILSVTDISKKSLRTPTSKYIFGGTFAWSNSTILVKDRIK